MSDTVTLPTATEYHTEKDLGQFGERRSGVKKGRQAKKRKDVGQPSKLPNDATLQAELYSVLDKLQRLGETEEERALEPSFGEFQGKSASCFSVCRIQSHIKSQSSIRVDDQPTPDHFIHGAEKQPTDFTQLRASTVIVRASQKSAARQNEPDFTRTVCSRLRGAWYKPGERCTCTSWHGVQ